MTSMIIMKTVISGKSCSGCEVRQPTTEFYKSGSAGDGLQSRRETRGRDTQRERRTNDDGQHRLYMKAWYLKKLYNITLEEYRSMFEAQGGVRAICKTPPEEGKYLPVDHDHATGAVRGLLCSSCNFGLGKFGDSVERLLAAAAYLGGQ